MIANGIAAAGGWAADQVLGEPPTPLHPVAWFGTAMGRVERWTWRDRRFAGVVHLAVGIGIAAGAGLGLQRLVGRPAATLIATTVAVAGRMLDREAAAILEHLASGDLDAARARLPALVGRDVTGLDASGVTRAVIESVAENTVDAVTAPLLWAAVGGAPAVLVHRAINTLDAMVGHHSDRYENFGWASAHADDIVNWLPARLSAACVAALTPARTREIWRAVRIDARRHPSPNGGVIEAAFAAALDVGLGGTNLYRGQVEDRGRLGAGPDPQAADGRRALRLATRLGAATALGAALSAVRSIRR